ncbi:YkvA family protein [Paeniglutamicibacter sp. MACA_103]|uniref:YkvA family protein n=1 Tax=Paeniglutamicibacter sp. MACA_103 TaxID=3377337 RepID=UPI0038931423
MTWLEVLLAAAGGLLLAYAALLALLWRHALRNPGTVRLGDALRLLPDVLRFLGRLVADRALKRWPRIMLALLLGYLASPIDLVPDFIPVIGYADDVLVVALVLRLIVRSSGRAALARNWRGSEAGMRLIEQLAGLPAPTPRQPGSTRPDAGS